MDLIDLFRRLGPRVWRWPIPVGCVVGALVAWGLAHPTCAFKKRGSGECAFRLPGEETPAGQLVWGLLAAAVTAVILIVMRAHDRNRSRDGDPPVS